MGEGMMQYGIDAPMIQDIPYEEIESILVLNASTIFVAQMSLEFLSAQVQEDAPIPGVFHGYEK